VFIFKSRYQWRITISFWRGRNYCRM